VVAGKTKLTRRQGGPTAQRESEHASKWSTALTRRARSVERENGRAREERHRQVGPTGQRESGIESERTWVVADRWDPPVRRSVARAT
jgi:hypothetical protein